jgi:hypothetical protein
MSDGNSGFNAVFGGVVPTRKPEPINRTYGSFSLQTDITILLPLLPTAITYSTIDLSNGIYPEADGTIYFEVEGTFMVDVTYNFYNNAPMSTNSGYVWCQKSGVDVPESTRLITLNPNPSKNTLSVSYMVEISDVSADTIQLFFTTSSTDLQLKYDNSVSGIPSVSSVICNVFQIA